MSTFSLNFNRTNRTKNWLGVCLFFSGLVALIYCYVNYSNLEIDTLNLENSLKKLSYKKPARTIPIDHLQLSLMKQQSELQRKVSSSLLTPWPVILHALEISKPELIRIAEIQTDVATSTIKISGQANQLEDVLTYVRKLKKEVIFGNVSLLNHQITIAESKTIVNFEIETSWIQL